MLPTTIAVALTAKIASCIAHYPHTLSYFNEIAGGPLNAAYHLLDANIDWGQDMLYFKEWYDGHPEARPMYLAWSGVANPEAARLQLRQVPRIPLRPQGEFGNRLDVVNHSYSGWHAISINELTGYKQFGDRALDYAWFREHQPAERVGYSTCIYHVSGDSSEH